MNISASSENSLNLDELPGVGLQWPSSLVPERSWNPSPIQNNGTPLNLNWISLIEELLERHLTSLVTIEGVDDHEAVLALGPFLGDEDLLGIVQLAEDEVGLEFMIYIEFLFWHSEPSEIHLLPGGHVFQQVGESVMAF